MSTEDEISDVENAKVSDGTSTAGDHNVDKVNDQPVVDDQGSDQNKTELNKQENDQVEEKTITINQKNQENEPKSEEPNEELTVV